MKLFQELKNYTKYKKNASYVFSSTQNKGKPVHRSTIHRRIKKAIKGLKFNASAHSMRKLYAHSIFDETHDLKKVQESLNHRNLTTTLAYLDIDPAEIMLQIRNEV